MDTILSYLALATSLCSLLGVVVWSVRQEGRINGHDQLFIEREKQLNERHADLIDRLDRIDSKLNNICAQGTKR